MINNTILDRFTRDLTEEARAGRLEPIRCRAAETSRLIDILLRYEKNNAALVGPADLEYLESRPLVGALEHRRVKRATA